ncbi:uncharacterized protein LOC124155584 [Ischnura elegans]|uniref:uncharacterized protein LOC124155584 n=1 Tax=Ischnura elegans TaxID=197161 RepID=UPI001ED8B413|nr:uncharacterized protein LOC124155584 [Ischnura elegans]
MHRRAFGSGRARSPEPRGDSLRSCDMLLLLSGVLAALAVGTTEASVPLNWVLVEATGSYLTGPGGQGCKAIPDSFEVRADGTWYSSQEFNLTGSMDDDCGISITLTIPLDDGTLSRGIEGGIREGVGGEIRLSPTEEAIIKLNATKQNIDDIFNILQSKMDKLDEITETMDSSINPKKKGTQEDATEMEKEKKMLEETKSKLEKDYEDAKDVKNSLEESLNNLKEPMKIIQDSNNEAEIASLNKYLNDLKVKLNRMEDYLKKMKLMLRRLEKRHDLLDSRMMLFEKRTRLVQLKKTLTEDKTKLQASASEVARRRKPIEEQLEKAKQAVKREKEDWDERLRKKRAENRAKQTELDARWAKLTSRWSELRADGTLRVLKKATATAKLNELKLRVEKIKEERKEAEEEASDVLEKLKLMYDMCTPVEEEIKIQFASIINVGIDQAWICSIDPDLLSGTA